MDSHRRFDRRLVWVRVPRHPPLSSDGSLAWLKRMLREHKTEGSNPSRPTISTWERSRLRVTSFGGGRLVGVSPTPATIYMHMDSAREETGLQNRGWWVRSPRCAPLFNVGVIFMCMTLLLKSLVRTILSESLRDRAVQNADKAVSDIQRRLGKRADPKRVRDNVMAWKYFTKPGQEYVRAFKDNQPGADVIKAQIEALTAINQTDKSYFIDQHAIEAMQNRFDARRVDRNRQYSDDRYDRNDYEWKRDRQKQSDDYLPAQDSSDSLSDDEYYKIYGQRRTHDVKTGGLSPVALARRGLDAKGNPLPQDVINKMAQLARDDEKDYLAQRLAQMDKNADSRNSANQDTEKDYADSTRAAKV